MSSQYMDSVSSYKKDSEPNLGSVKNSSWFKIGTRILVGAIINISGSGNWV